jgi:uncharacterized membrane protein YesL
MQTKQAGFTTTLIVSILITGLFLFTHFYKELYVHETGRFLLFGQAGLLLAIALLFRWQLARPILAFFSTVGTLLLAIDLFTSEYGHVGMKIVTIAVLVVVSYLLLFSKDVKLYLEG